MRESDLLAAHLPSLYRTAWLLTRNDADAEDLAHDTMVAALTGWGRFRAEAKVGTWLVAILVNRYRQWRRGSAVRERHREAVGRRLPAQDEGADVRAEEAERRELVRAALVQLDDDERLTVVLCVYRGLNSEDAGAVLGCPAGTVRYRLHEARTKLRTILEAKLGHGE